MGKFLGNMGRMLGNSELELQEIPSKFQRNIWCRPYGGALPVGVDKGVRPVTADRHWQEGR